jgi:hypothetical protein
VRLAAGASRGGPLRFSSGHIGGDCTLTGPKSNGICGRVGLPRSERIAG